MANTITTNNQPRNFKAFNEFTPQEQAKLRREFDWVVDIECDGHFFTYKGRTFHINEFTSIIPAPHEALYGWHGMAADTAFSGTLIRIEDPGSGQLIVGTYS